MRDSSSITKSEPGPGRPLPTGGDRRAVPQRANNSSPDRGVVIRSRRLRALGLETRVLEGGDASLDEAVVFLHGQPGSAEDWLDLMERAAGFARVIAFDLPGFGKADKPHAGREWNYSPGTYATFFNAAFTQLGVKRAHLVMHDLGGTGLLWGAAHPNAFASAVLISTGVLLGYKWHLSARLFRAPLVGELMARMTTRTGFRIVMRRYNPQPRPLPDRHLERWFEDYGLATRRSMIGFYRATAPGAMARLRDPLRELDRPALVLWGAHDPAVPASQAARQRESFPSAEVVVLDESGHWPYLDDPERSAKAILPFLREQLKPA
jgi:pimeloyl-ACP methyl ester carboxylesterase